MIKEVLSFGVNEIYYLILSKMKKEIYKTDSYWIWFNIELYWYWWDRFVIRFQLWNKILSLWDYDILKPRYDDNGLKIWFIISNKLIWIFIPKLVNYFDDYLKNFIWFRIWRLFGYDFVKKRRIRLYGIWYNFTKISI